VVHWLSPQWGGAAFIDYGGASDDRRALNAAAGYGVGARWRSPVGVFAGDIAYGQRTGKARLEISIAVPFR
jgi:translocation and assembly module TamA